MVHTDGSLQELDQGTWDQKLPAWQASENPAQFSLRKLSEPLEHGQCTCLAVWAIQYGCSVERLTLQRLMTDSLRSSYSSIAPLKRRRVMPRARP